MNHLVDRELFGRNKIFFLIRRSWERERGSWRSRENRKREREEKEGQIENQEWSNERREKSCCTCSELTAERLTGHWPLKWPTYIARGRWMQKARKAEGEREKERRGEDRQRGKGIALERAEGVVEDLGCQASFGRWRTPWRSISAPDTHPSRPPVAAVKIHRERIHRERIQREKLNKE